MRFGIQGVPQTAKGRKVGRHGMLGRLGPRREVPEQVGEGERRLPTLSRPGLFPNRKFAPAWPTPQHMQAQDQHRLIILLLPGVTRLLPRVCVPRPGTLQSGDLGTPELAQL